jgi:hypothetical protein
MAVSVALAVMAILLPTAAGAIRAADPVLTEAWDATAPETTGFSSIGPIDASGGRVAVAGYIDGPLDEFEPIGPSDVYVELYEADGDLVWRRMYGTIYTDDVHDIALADSGVYISGKTRGDGFPTGFVVRYDADGEIDWTKELEIETDALVQLAALDVGGVAVATTDRGGSGELPARVTRLRADGSTAWTRTHLGCCGSLGSKSAHAVEVDADPGGVTVTGWQPQSGVPWHAVFVRRWGLDGTDRWTHTVTSPDGDVLPDTAVVSERRVVLAGSSTLPLPGLPSGPDDDWFLRSLDLDGKTAWTKGFVASRLVAQCRGFVGTRPEPGDAEAGEHPGAIIERRGEDGEVVWSWGRPGTTEDQISFERLAIDGDRIYVVESAGLGGDSTYRVIAFDGMPAPTDCDTTPPTASTDGRTFVTGTSVTDGRLPLRLKWTATASGARVARFEVHQSVDGKAFTALTTASSGSLNPLVAPSHTYRFRGRAIDQAGNASPWSATSTITVSRVSENNARIRYSGSWATTTSPVYWGGAAKRSSSAGARATLIFTGRTIAWVSRRGPDRGKAEIYVNGTKVATVDLKASSYQGQRVVWTRSWSTTASRTVSIRVLGTSGRPRVDLDAFVTAN